MIVFGFDVPLFEFLLVFMVLLTAGLLFILIEMRRLNEYLAQERKDLLRFEKDLKFLESEERRLDDEEQAIIKATKNKAKKKR